MGGFVNLETDGRVYNAVLTWYQLIALAGAAAEDLEVAQNGYQLEVSAEERRPKGQVPHQFDHKAEISQVQRYIDTRERRWR